jgi:hypothetical protein
VARFLSPRWLVRHALAAGLVAAFLALGWWQIGRAAHGNPLSLGYAVEWPLFAAFVVAVWVREIRVELRGGAPDPRREPRYGAAPGAGGLAGTAVAGTGTAAGDGTAAGARPGHVPFRAVVPQHRGGRAVGDGGDEDPQLAAYNRYLAWLGAHPDRPPGDYPG